MSITSTFEPFDRENVFYDLETWAGMFESLVKDNPSAADSLALLMYKIIRVLSVGEGVIETETVINTLKLGVEWVYPFSTAHKKSFKLYLYYLECVLTPQDFPEELLQGAIERAEAKATEIEAPDEMKAAQERGLSQEGQHDESRRE
jgi:hypothetical protein